MSSTNIFLEGPLTIFANSSVLFSMALKVFHKTRIEFKNGSYTQNPGLNQGEILYRLLTYVGRYDTVVIVSGTDVQNILQ